MSKPACGAGLVLLDDDGAAHLEALAWVKDGKLTCIRIGDVGGNMVGEAWAKIRDAAKMKGANPTPKEVDAVGTAIAKVLGSGCRETWDGQTAAARKLAVVALVGAHGLSHY